MTFRTDCLEFLGDRPCKPHKLRGRTCDTCPEYIQERGRLLLVKLGALGDVVRTLPLLEALAKAYVGCSIWVVTQNPLFRSFRQTRLSDGWSCLNTPRFSFLR